MRKRTIFGGKILEGFCRETNTSKQASKEESRMYRYFQHRRKRPREKNAVLEPSKKRARKEVVRESLYCREDHIGAISKFLTSHLEDRVPGALYISGPPGTGKTACVEHVLKREAVEKSAVLVNINCVSINKIYSRLGGELGCVGERKALARHLTSSKKMIVLVLDEVDALKSASQEVLYTLFGEWPRLPGSTLVLIGISNTIDLTDQMLPRLQACSPEFLPFKSYSKSELSTILQNTLGQEALEPSAIEFCCRKIAALNGDLRKALDVCRRGVESAQGERVTIRHIAELMSKTEAPSQDSMPVQQKIVLCSLINVVKRRKKASLGNFYEDYSSLCKSKKLKNLPENEFDELIEHLEQSGVVGVTKAKERRAKKLFLRRDLTNSLHDGGLMSSIIDHA